VGESHGACTYNDELYRNYLKLTVYTAGRLAPYQDPQLATVKVGGDRDSPLIVREGVTSKQIMEELRQKILETGLLPSRMVDVTPNKVNGVRGTGSSIQGKILRGNVGKLPWAAGTAYNLPGLFERG
jgi:hypothetical protein